MPEDTPPPSRRAALHALRERFPWQALAIEVFSIILAVLLALGVNEWRETRNQRVRSQDALEQVRRELAYNRKVLALLHDTNSAVVEAFGVEDASDSTEAKFIPGLQLRATAWESAQRSDALQHVDYGITLDLARLYATQKIYQTMGNQVIEATMNALALAAANGRKSTVSDVILELREFVSLIVEVEGSLIDLYDDLLPRLDRDTD